MENNNDTNVWRAIKVVRENDSINSLFLEGGNDRIAGRKAGQYASIRLKKGGDWSMPHPFTISCAPESDFLQFTIKKAGEFTSSIQDIKPGEEVKVAGPLGKFLSGIDSKENIVMVAGGVGITPFLSLLRHFRMQGIMNNAMLVWVNRDRNEMLAVDELRQMTKELRLRIINSFSREDDAAKYFDSAFPGMLYQTGRFSAETLERYDIDKSSATYICGPPAMQEAAIETLVNYGIARDLIETESFTFNSK